MNIDPPSILVTSSEYGGFESAIKEVVEEDRETRQKRSGIQLRVISSLHWHDEETGAYVVSFDGQWQPFVGDTCGYNQPSSRHPLPSGLPFLQKILPHLKYLHCRLNENIPGGRFFFGKEAVWKKHASGTKHVAVKFTVQ